MSEPRELPPIKFVTTQAIIHKPSCPFDARLAYADGIIYCLVCGASVPSEIQPR
jgi:hypothetical protein